MKTTKTINIADYPELKTIFENENKLVDNLLERRLFLAKKLDQAVKEANDHEDAIEKAYDKFWSEIPAVFTRLGILDPQVFNDSNTRTNMELSHDQKSILITHSSMVEELK